MVLLLLLPPLLFVVAAARQLTVLLSRETYNVGLRLAVVTALCLSVGGLQARWECVLDD